VAGDPAAGFTPTAPSFFMVEAHYSRTADSGVVWKLVGAASRITMEGGLEGSRIPMFPVAAPSSRSRRTR